MTAESPAKRSTAGSPATDDGQAPQSVAQPPAARMFLGLRVSALIEVGLFLGLFLAVDLLLLDGNRYAHVQPHPFWIVVLLLTVQYGTGEGLLAAVLSSAALLIGNLPEQSIDQELYDYLIDVAGRPLMWFVTVVVLGELRNRQLRERSQLYESLAALERRVQRLTQANRQLNAQKDSLEVRVAGQLSSFVKTYQAAQAIERKEPGEVLLGVVDVIRSVIRARKFSLFLLNANVLEAAIQDGWAADDGYARVFNQKSSLFQEVVGNRRILCVANEADQAILGDEGVLAGPLVSAETGDVIGMLKIEDMNLLDLNVSTVENFRVLSSWIGTAYAKALATAVEEAEPEFYVGRGIIPHRYFSTQHYFMVSLARRVGFDVSAVILHLTNGDELNPEVLASLPHALSEAVRLSLGSAALAFEHQHEGESFVVLLPGTSVETAREAAARLVVSLRAQLGDHGQVADFEVTVQSLYQHAARKAANERAAR